MTHHQEYMGSSLSLISPRHNSNYGIMSDENTWPMNTTSTLCVGLSKVVTRSVTSFQILRLPRDTIQSVKVTPGPTTDWPYYRFTKVSLMSQLWYTHPTGSNRSTMRCPRCEDYTSLMLLHCCHCKFSDVKH